MIVQSVERALKLLSLFSYSRPVIGGTEIAQALGISKGAAHNLAHTLEKSGFIDQDRDTKKFRLGVMSLALGSIASGTLEINQKGAGPVNYLAEKTQLLCRIGIWNKGRAVVTMNAAPHSRVPFVPHFGPLIPAYCTVIGKALLAFLPLQERKEYLDHTQLIPYTQWTITDRKQLEAELRDAYANGYAVTRQEIIPGRAALAAPVFSSTGALVGAIALSGDMNQILGKQMPRLISEIKSAASEVSASMGYEPTALKGRNS